MARLSLMERLVLKAFNGKTTVAANDFKRHASFIRLDHNDALSILAALKKAGAVELEDNRRTLVLKRPERIPRLEVVPVTEVKYEAHALMQNILLAVIGLVTMTIGTVIVAAVVAAANFTGILATVFTYVPVFMGLGALFLAGYGIYAETR